LIKTNQTKMTNLKYLFFIFIFFGSISVGHSQILKKHRDSIDGAIDLSHFLSDLNGVLPVLSPITEPAVGYGLAGAGLYFINKEPQKNQTFQKPDIVGIGAGFTENGTWFVGGGYSGIWKNDHIRYRGIFAYGDVNLTYYSQLLPDKSKEFNLTSYFFLQQALFRIKESNFFFGGKYQLSKINIDFLLDSNFPNVTKKDFDLWNSGISLISEFDNYNNIFSPTKGTKVHLSYDQNLELLGSDRDWGTFNFYSVYYYPVSKTWIPGLRIASRLATGETPFYAKPYIELRGVPAMRYQGDLTALIETEQLFNLNPRWGLVAFGGLGNTFNKKNDYHAEELVWNAGGGFRYMLARIFGLKMGLDVARGPEDWAVYVVFGSSWLR